jgi:hypothetical protein
MFVAENPSGVNMTLSMRTPDAFGLIEATSNSGTLAAAFAACGAAWLCATLG